MVSRYTWGFAKVKIAIVVIALTRLDDFLLSVIIAEFDLDADLSLKTPYMKS